MNALSILAEAEELHRQLVNNNKTHGKERAERLNSLLGSVQNHSPKTDRIVLLVKRLQADAYFRAGVSDAEGVRQIPEVWEHYSELRRSLSK